MQYIVQPGDTLTSIARRFNVTVDAILRANPNITDPNVIFVGQIIIIPIGPGPGPGPEPGICPLLREGSRGPAVRFLQARLASLGFNPGRIDGVFGPRTRAAVIAFQRSRNLPPTGVVDVATWTALGVNCRIPPIPPPPRPNRYVVQPGDTLSSIARRFGVTVEALLRANPQIRDPNLIFPGQVIFIPRR